MSLKLFPYFVLFLSLNLLAQTKDQKHFKWDSIESFKDKRGLNGAFLGIHNDVFIVAGGSNFAEAPVWEGGSKSWYDNIEVLQKNESGYKWIENIQVKLPRPLAYGASVSTKEGVLCIGGNNEKGVYNDVFLLKWNISTQTIEIEEKPPLPVPLANFQATSIGNEIFVVGGQDKEGAAATNYFFSFKNGVWKRLPDLPGPGRIQPVVISQNNGKTNSVYVFSGIHYDPQANDPNQFLDDAYEYNPLQKKWDKKSSVPYNKTPGLSGGYIGAAPAIKSGDAHIIIFGGAGGERQLWNKRLNILKQIDQLEPVADKKVIDSLKYEITQIFQNTSFSPTVWAYHTISERPR